MIRFIWNSWWRNKDRFILLIIGVLLLSVGLSYLVGVTQSNNGTIVNELQKRWKSSYHLVVRPEGSRSVTEEMNLLEPNYLSGLHGGITMEQYETIKGMDDVSIAAPISMIGSVGNYVDLGKAEITEPGVYRIKTIETVDTGAGKDVSEGDAYFTVGGWDAMSAGMEYGVVVFDGKMSYGTEILVAGIDPEQEAKLVGIDEAMLVGKSGRYFKESDKPEEFPIGDGLVDTRIPVIMSNQEFIDGEMNYVFEKLDLPFAADEQSSTMEDVKKKGGEEFLKTVNGTVVKEYTYTTQEAHKKTVDQVMNPSYMTGSGSVGMRWMLFKPTPVEYRPVSSPFPDRWAYSYEVTPYDILEDSLLAADQSYRPVELYGEKSAQWPRLRLDVLGVFDPGKLNISKDPLNELPVETYFPSSASWVLDRDEEPVNPPVAMKPTNNPYGYLTKPPLMLTTLEAASKIIGKDPISAIRVNVTGVEQFNEESEARLQQVADKIEKETGLIVDVTLGSSPQPALTHIPGIDGEKSVGWIEQPWIKIGSSMTIFKEAKLGISGVVGSVVAVAIVYVFSSNLIMMYGRKKEFAVFLSLGWRPGQLSKLLLLEAAVLGLTVSLISWMILGWFMYTSPVETSGLRVFLIGLLGLLIYLLGALIPAVLVRKIEPYETMKSGEISNRQRRVVKSHNVVGMALNGLLSKWKRTGLSVFSMGLPSGMLLFFLFITFRLKGVMFTTWLGEYVAMEVSTMHYVAMGIALLIAILTTAEIIWQNVSERQPEIAVLKALGWRNQTIRGLVMMEGAISGLFAGVLGLFCAFLLIWSMYGELPYEQIWLYVLTMLIPMVTGTLASILPAQKAARITPYQGLNGGVQNSKKTEKQFKIILSAAGIALFLGVASLITHAVSSIEHTETVSLASPEMEKGTEGETVDQYEKKEKEEQEKTDDDTTSDSASLVFSSQKELAYRAAMLGESILMNEEHYHFGKLVKTPENVKKPKKGHRLITIPVEAEFLFSEYGNDRYNPNMFQLIDEEYTSYDAVDVQIPTSRNYSAGKLKMPAVVSALLTFEVPEKFEHFLFKGGKANQPGPFAVEITPEDVDADREAYVPSIHLGTLSNTRANYMMDVSLGEDDTFTIEATAVVNNQSDDEWKDVGFYFIPNALTDAEKPASVKGSVQTAISSVKSSDTDLEYSLENDKLVVTLDEKLPPGEKKWITFNYTLKVPEDGLRLSRKGNSFFLAQWYPMLAPYEKGWKLEAFNPKGESYHTTYGDYTINVSLPRDYHIASSGRDLGFEPVTDTTIEAATSKDFYLALLDPDEWEGKSIEASTGMYAKSDLRLFLPKGKGKSGGEMLSFAQEAFEYFNTNIGSYPFKELDIVANMGNMEYPNVVEVSHEADGYQHTIAHELAHQWFYYLVSNDPIEDAWLDEGMSELAASLFLSNYYEDEGKGYSFAEGIFQQSNSRDNVNRRLDEYGDEYHSLVYGKVPLILHDYFSEHGGKSEALNFLSAYYTDYQFNEVDSRIFAAFFENHVEGDQEGFLDEWIDLKE
ncbi:hypothetical protein LCM10_10240 [Rossellomorea aquimaris]|uniref:FtsX-like permease family protein n=1 Tax=Rossellomorea aquimaris TaxID=189382 RepID=UPI001CD63FD5|nr:FtsX-like permease family protein [Rossellomorea aquimaris]MCA1055364.1 hypothetical protein [Rossellomorea aquimaris]